VELLRAKVLHPYRGHD